MQKTIDDYIPAIKEKYPEITEPDIKKMLHYGWRRFYRTIIYGCDVVLNNSKTWLYCGRLVNDSIQHFHYYKFKIVKKLRQLYKDKKIEWDGCYYTGISEEEYNEIIKDSKRAGLKKSYRIYTNRRFYKLFDEARLRCSRSKAIIQFDYIIDLGFSFRCDKLKCRNVKIKLVRDHYDTFADILLTTNNYEII